MVGSDSSLNEVRVRVIRRSLTRCTYVFWKVSKRSTKLKEQSDEGGADYVAAAGL